MHNLKSRQLVRAASRSALLSSFVRRTTSAPSVARFDAFERRRLLSDGSPSPTVCPTCGGSHSICVSGDPAWQMQVAEQLGLAEPGGLEYQVGGRWSSTAANPSTGGAGNPITLSWGLVADGTSVAGFNGEATANSTLQARLNAIYGSSATWLPVFQSVFDRWSSLAGLTYTFFGLSDDGAAMTSSSLPGGVTGVRPDIRITGHPIDGASNVLAYNFFPDFGDMVIDTNDLQGGGYMTNIASSSIRLRNVLAHEHGHGLGFNHVEPVTQTKLMEPFVSTNFDGPQFDDILAAQSNYGDPFEKGGRNDTAATASNLGTLGNLTNSAVSAWVNANNPTSARSIANTGDLDFLKFTISGTKNVSFTVAPFGPTYVQGPQGGSTASFNASAQGNLSIALISTNGSTVLSSANATGLGGSETVTFSSLTAGTYYLRVGLGTGNTTTPTQAYNVNATIADSVAVPPAAPSTPDLATGSDSGSFNNDNLTNDNTPTFTGTAEVGSTVNILFNGVSVGSAVATVGSYTITTSTRPDGTYNVTATATNAAGTGPASGALSVTIDTTAPLAPQNFRVLPADDTGASNSDNVTKDNTPRITGDTEAGAAVDIAGPGSFAGNFTGGAGFVASFGAATLPEGVSNLIATSTDLAGNFSAGISSLNVTVDTIAPAAPTANTLFTNDDSGASATDGITNVTTPRIAGSAENNALVEVLSGATVLGSGTSTGTYLSSALPPRPEGSQSYDVRATDLAGNVSTNGLVTFTIDSVAPAAPTANTLFTNDDSGVSATDGITNVTTPRIAGSAENNALVEVLSGATVLASATSTGSYLSSALPTQPEGSQNYDVRATDLAGNVSTTNGLVTFLIDTTAPAITGRTFIRSNRQSLAVDFSENVFNSGSLQFNNTTTSATFGTTPIVIDGDTIEYQVPGNALTDGAYTANFSAGTMTDLAGNAATASNPVASLNYLRADFNNDGSVNFDDLLLLAATYNGAGNNTQGDANYDGTVNFDDLLILAGSYNTSLPGVSAIAAPPAPVAGDADDDDGASLAGDVL